MDNKDMDIKTYVDVETDFLTEKEKYDLILFFANTDISRKDRNKIIDFMYGVYLDGVEREQSRIAF